MNENQTTPRAGSSSGQDLQFLVALRRFEDAWESGDRPRAEVFAAQWPPEEQGALLPRLLALEVEIRQRGGEEPSLDELAARFPANPQIVFDLLLTVVRPDSHDPDALRDEGAQDHDNDPGDDLRTLGRYQVTGRIGVGGFGTVYSASDGELTRTVAIKVLHRRWTSLQSCVDDFLKEARVVAQLDHPNVVPVYDFGRTDDGRPFVVSKFVEGSNLRERLKERRPSSSEAVGIAAAIAEALHYAHLHGLVHRDVKPSNILIDGAGKAYLADFGMVLREQEFGQGPTFAGTPAYMSPEQAQSEGHRVDGRSDVFSLGVVFYEMLTGRKPFQAESHEDLLSQLIEVDPRPPRQVDDAIPRELERICLKALSKRASDRFSTANDMAEDLRFSQQRPAGEDTVSAMTALSPAASGAAEANQQSASPNEATPTAALSATPAFDRLGLQIVPKGLRSFDGHDADFFLELLPGPRDREGLPESIRFWKTRIEETDPDETFSVGLIYGPSGCGKSSLVKAGLLPRLVADVQAVYVESTSNNTEARLLHSLRKRFPGLAAEELSLQESLAALRRGMGLAPGHKALIVLDQFEQWLHAHSDDENAELIRALRQCDGSRVQALVMVRDDFWMSVSRLFDNLEINLDRARNARAHDLFDPDHSRRVLRMFGEAYGRLPARPQSLTSEQQGFLNRAVSGLTQEGHVIPVRLSLLADMMKERPWTSSELVQSGGAEGVGVRFLEETFSSRSALPELRMLEQPARRLLQALLPERGADIKGQVRSREELATACGMTEDSVRFGRLIEILDRELHILTPTEAAREPDATGRPTPTQLASYQLTHDFLVPALRQWLTSERQKTWRGRAELCLEDRTRLWSAANDARFLPSAREFAAISLAVPPRKQSLEQKAVMRAARRHHGLRWGSAAAVIGIVLLGIWIQQLVHRANLVDNAVTELLSTSAEGVARKIERLRPYSEQARPILKARFDDQTADVSSRLHAACGLAAFGSVDPLFLIRDAIPQAAGSECRNIVTALLPAKDNVADSLLILSRSSETPELAARYATVLLHLGDARAAQELARIGPDPARRTAFILGLENWRGDLTTVADILRTSNDGPLCSALCAAAGNIKPAQLEPAELESLKRSIGVKFQTASDSGTHSSAGWALRNWNLPAPGLVPSTPAGAVDRDWAVTKESLTLIKMTPDVFLMGDPDDHQDLKRHQVRLTRPFWIGDRPIPVALFQQFLSDPTCPEDQKPADWGGHDERISPTADCPIQSVNWSDSILFCNWLSAKCGLEPCYERIMAPGNDDQPRMLQWRWLAKSNGYRLPTEAEWEYTCRAASSTRYSFGAEDLYLPRFGQCRETHTLRCGSLMPNAWGAFDMHGNITQWCWDRFHDFDSAPVVDPTGPSEGFYRVLRGGYYAAAPNLCRASMRYRTDPSMRMGTAGIRVARTFP